MDVASGGDGAGALSEDRGKLARRRLYQAMLEELAEKGYRGMTVAGIIARAGASKGAFYHHFRDKRDIFTRWYREHTGRAETAAKTDAFRGLPPHEIVIKDLIGFVRELPGREFLRAMLELHLHASDEPELSEALRNDYFARTGLARSLIEGGVAAGLFKKDTDPDTVARAIYSGVFGIYLTHVAMGEDEELTARIERFLRMLFDGLLAQAV